MLTPVLTNPIAPSDTSSLDDQLRHNREDMGALGARVHEASVSVPPAAADAHESQQSTWAYFREHLPSYLIALISLTVYFVIGCLIYENGEGWTRIESIYFCVVTMSTVGYGDFSPSPNHGWIRFATVCMIFVGILGVFSQIATAFGTLTSPITNQGRALLERLLPQKKYDIDGDGSADYTIPLPAPIYYCKGMLPSILLNLTVQLTSAALFVHIEGWSYGDAMYHCLVTATTVGYGDQPIEGNGGMILACVHILISVVLLAEAFSSIALLAEERKAHLRRADQLARKLDEKLLENLMRNASLLRPQVNHDGGLTELEFAFGMLMELELVSWAQVRPFILQFRELDKDRSGRINKDDLKEAMEAKAKDLENKAHLHSRPSSMGKSASFIGTPKRRSRKSQVSDTRGFQSTSLRVMPAETASTSTWGAAGQRGGR